MQEQASRDSEITRMSDTITEHVSVALVATVPHRFGPDNF